MSEKMEGTGVTLEEYIDMTDYTSGIRRGEAIEEAVDDAMEFAIFCGVKRGPEANELFGRIQSAIHLALVHAYADTQDKEARDYSLGEAPPDVHDMVKKAMHERIKDDPNATIREAVVGDPPCLGNHPSSILGDPNEVSLEVFMEQCKEAISQTIGLRMHELPDHLVEDIEAQAEKLYEMIRAGDSPV